MNNMPPALREDCANDPLYKTCMRRELLNDHICKSDPRTGKLIEWEHALIFASKQVQKKFAIVPICWWAHSGPGLVKEINEWIAINRATDEELQSLSKVVNYFRKREYLNSKYGIPKFKKS
jgi:hypothetical protein